jgi:putative NADH-flavin reductase
MRRTSGNIPRSQFKVFRIHGALTSRLRWCLLWLVVSMAGIGTVQAADPLRVVVYGGTGNIGQRIVHEALDRGDMVTVVVRDPSVMPERLPQLRVVKGDVLKANDVARIVSGADVVVSAVSFGKSGADFSGFTRAGKSLVSALRTFGSYAPYLIVVGGAGSLEQPPGVHIEPPPEWKEEIKGQNDSLAYYRSINNVRWTYFSPAAMITRGTRTGKFRLGGDQMIADAQGNSQISMEDYAVAVLDEAEKPAHVHQRFTIGY